MTEQLKDDIQLLHSLYRNSEEICNLLDEKPYLVDYLDNEIIVSNVYSKVHELALSGKYKINNNTPIFIIEKLLNIYEFLENALKEDFSLIYIFSKVIEKNKNFNLNNEKLYNICKENNYVITKDSPYFLKNNFYLMLDALKNKTLKLDDVDLNIYYGWPLNYLMQIVDVAILNNEESNTIKKYKEKIFNKCITKENNRFYLNDKNIHASIFASLPDDITEIHISERLQVNSKFINEITNAINASRRNIKVIIPMLEKDFYDDKFLEDIEDKDKVFFESLTRFKDDVIKVFSTSELLLINKTLNLFVKNINNSSLSPYEKYIVIYNMVKGFKKYKFYNDNEADDFVCNDASRNVYLLMQNDFIVCAGYINLLVLLLKKVGINSVRTDYVKGNHALAYVNIKDYKYNINGYYKCDITGDSCNDILNAGYNFIHETPESTLFKTDFDDNLKNLDYSIKEYLKALDPEFYEKIINMAEDNKIKLISSYINEKIKNPISNKVLLDGIMEVKQFVYENKFTNDEIRKEKNLFCLNARRNVWYKNFNELIDGYSDDILKKKTELYNCTFKTYALLNGRNNYDERCLKEAINSELIKLDNLSPNVNYEKTLSGDIKLNILVPQEEKELAMSLIEDLQIKKYITGNVNDIFAIQADFTKEIGDMTIPKGIEYLSEIINEINSKLITTNKKLG